MYLVKKTYDNSPEFLRNEHYENITCTVLDTGVTADTEGKKFVLAGSLLDKDGKVVKVARSGSSGAYTYTFSTEPVGILFATTEVTYGQQAGALMIAGSVNTERLQGNTWLMLWTRWWKRCHLLNFCGWEPAGQGCHTHSIRRIKTCQE